MIASTENFPLIFSVFLVMIPLTFYMRTTYPGSTRMSFTINLFRMNLQDCMTKRIVNHPSGWLTYKLGYIGSLAANLVAECVIRATGAEIDMDD